MKHLYIALIAFGLSGCADTLENAAQIYEQGGEKAVSLTSRLLNVECARTEARRKAYLEAVNAKQAERGKTPRAMAMDCDGDGASDF